jgi:hypothetical protein
MENYEMIETTEMENAENTEECSGMSTGKAMLIGGLITAGAIAVGKFAKKKWNDHKAKKEQAKMIECAPEQADDDSEEDE